jgi:hypothetical protein
MITARRRRRRSRTANWPESLPGRGVAFGAAARGPTAATGLVAREDFWSSPVAGEDGYGHGHRHGRGDGDMAQQHQQGPGAAAAAAAPDGWVLFHM